MQRRDWISNNTSAVREIWFDGSLWWNIKYNSGPWYLRKYDIEEYEWIIGVDDGVMRPTTAQEIDDSGNPIGLPITYMGSGGGRLYRKLDDATKMKILTEFEPYDNQDLVDKNP